ncbi:cytochrome P450 2C8-like isoform X1 [Elgaria multicarinata webbii]|uniref:cytochrome P450 2C8-like isoform X1 n=1 Tax=Elgaria multicarinata webbii TaxID=159646 RepID=UPI002FCCC55D
MEVAGVGALFLLCVLLTLFFSSFKMYKKKGQLPPGPAPWFLLGNLLQKDVLPLYQSYPKLMEKYGSVFTLWMGPKPLVVLCGYEVVKDALVGHAEEFGGRFAIPIHDRISKGQGLLKGGNEKKWRELRRFTISTLRDFGMGKKTMSARVQEEALYLVEEMATAQGKPFDPRRCLTSAVSNVISSVLYGSRFDYKDGNLIEQLQFIDERFLFMRSYLGTVYSTIPTIMDCLPGQHRKILANSEKLCGFIREKLRSHRETLDPQNPRDYIDCFLMRAEKEQNSPKDFYGSEDLVMCVNDLFVAGTISTSNTLLYSLLVMAKLPHVQAKVQQEIDDVLSGNHTPGMEDRVRMPFTNAVVHETQRYQRMTLEALPLAMTHHTEFRGYTIPKGTAVTPLLTSVHFDPTQWETPEKFNPGHFLDEKGQFRKRDAFMPFSAGKHACPGEALARMELFLFFSTLLQNFTFKLDEDAKTMDIMSLFIAYRIKNQYPPIQAIRRSV